MSTKYLGKVFDIHGGGMDLLFPHHECEIAQSTAANGYESVKYWLHNNMITINGQKMGKSLGNFITLEEFFKGSHKSLKQAFNPMTIRFFILQAHYTSTLDFSNEALIAAEKGFNKLFLSFKNISKIKPSDHSTVNINDIKLKCYDAMNDDFNSPILIANLFECSRIINSVIDKKEQLTDQDIKSMQNIFDIFLIDILGLKDETSNTDDNLTSDLMKVILSIRQNAKNNKDYATSDIIRNELQKLNISIKDTKEGAEWNLGN
jgi:cysteinyl-tRNA synthetase